MPKNITRFAILFVLFLPVLTGLPAQSAAQSPSDNPNYLPIISKPDHLYLAFVMKPEPPRPLAWLGLQGGPVQTVAIDPQNTDIVYAGTWGAGVYKSTDGGQSWEAGRVGLGNQLLWSVAVDPHDSSIVYAGLHKDGLYKSVDGGRTWVSSSNGIQKDAVVYTIAIDPLDSNRIFIGTRGIAATCDGASCPPWAGVIYKSANAGASWTPAVTNIGGSQNQFWAYTILFDLLDPDRVFAAIDGAPGLLRSLNGGRSWSADMAGIANPKGRGIAFDLTSASPVIAYYGGWQAHNYTNMFKSTNGGDTWSPKNNGISTIDIWKLAMTNTTPPTLFACTYHNGLKKSTDGGNTWHGAGVPAAKVNAVAVNLEKPSIIYAGSDDVGLYKTTDGGAHWALSQEGLITTWSTSLLVSPEDKNRLFMSTYGAGVFQSLDGGLTWINMGAGLGDLYIHTMLMDPAHTNILFALTDTKGLYRYDLTLGGNWAPVSAGLPAFVEGQTVPNAGDLSYGPDYPFAIPEKPDSDVYPELYAPQVPVAPAAKPPYLAMTYAPSDPQAAYLGTYGSGVYRSSDGGNGWSPVGLSGYVVWGLAVDPGNPELVYAATSTPGSVKYSDTGGNTWLDASLPDAGLVVYSLAFSRDGSGILYAGTTQGVYQLVGGVWTALGLSGSTVTALGINPAQPGILFAGAADGAYYSTDGGLSWQPGPAQLASLKIQAITFDPFYPFTAYYSTTANGVLRAPLN